jgi:beta-barrel assembly-enhancing protease
MRPCFKKIICFWMVLALVAGWQPAASVHALSIKEEKELADAFLKAVHQAFEVVDDPMINDYINRVGQSIVSVFPPQPFEYRFSVIRQNTFNAFAGPAGNIFVYSGLFEAIDNEHELAALLAHEIAHVSSRHIADLIAKSKRTSLASMAGVIAGILIGIGGAPTAGSALTIGSMAAGQTMILAYTRENEMQADQISRTYLQKAGYELSAMLSLLKKIRSKDWFDTGDIPTYLKTHPATEARIVYLDALLENQKIPKIEPEPEFLRVRTRLTALYGDVNAALRRFTSMIEKNPEDPEANYGYGLILARSGNPKAAVPHLEMVVANKPDDPYVKHDLGRIYFQAGDFENALALLQTSPLLRKGGPEGLFFLARSQMLLGRLQDAAETFLLLIRDYPDYSDALLFMGITLGELEDFGGAHYHLGHYYLTQNDYKVSSFHFNKALEHETGADRREKIDAMLKRIETGQPYP